MPDRNNSTKFTAAGSVLSVVAIAWSLFQISIASWLILDSTFIRAIHLGFALFLAFGLYPARKKGRSSKIGIPGMNNLRSSSTQESPAAVEIIPWTKRITWIDWVLAGTGCLAALYIALDYTGIAARYGLPLPRDIIIGVFLTVILLESTRRVVGPALPVIAMLFCGYAFLGPHMPDLIAFRGVTLNRFIGQITMSTEGIYGIPLDVSATIVFLFVLFGAMLDKAGAGRYFIQLAMSALGGFKGGPAKAAIVGSGLTGMVSGSSIANIVTTGTFTIPMMKKVGYPATKAAAIEVAASTDGQLAPPIMGAAAFIIAEYVNVPYISVIKAAAIPAFASYAALLFISHIEASKLGLKGVPRKELPLFFKTLIGGIHFILPLAVLLFELMVMRHSPEQAAVKSVGIMAVIMLVQGVVRARRAGESIRRGLTRGTEAILESLAAGARNMVTVALATAAAGIIVGVVSMGLGGLITEVIDVISMGNVFLMLVITALASLLIGMGLPTTATYIVMASLTAPAIVFIAGAQDFFVPLMAAHLFCFYFGILADDTPPVGLAAYAAAAIAKSPPIPTGIQGFMYDIRTAILPFMFIFNPDLILHNIHGWGTGLLIFAMACIGNFAFASATQGWFITRNRWYEIPLLLTVTLILMQPQLIASWIHLPITMKYWAYIPGLALWGGLWAVQRRRAHRHPPTPYTVSSSGLSGGSH